MIIAGLLISIIGGAVLALPRWLPALDAGSGALGIAGQVGGALTGAGLALVVLGLWRGRR